MSSYEYRGFVFTILGTGNRVPVINAARLRVRPESEAFSPDGLVVSLPMERPINGTTGEFAIDLYPSGELTNAQTGRTGVDYIISVDLLGLGGPNWRDVWKFTAVAGGGYIGDMKGGSLLAVWIGPPWPLPPLPKGLYIDTVPPNAWGIKE